MMRVRFITGLIVAALAVSSAPAAAQAPKVGDRVECDWLQNGTFDIGTIVPFTSTDADTKSGRWYRVKLDKDKIPNSTVECMAARMRVPVKQPTASATEERSKPAPPSPAPAGGNRGASTPPPREQPQGRQNEPPKAAAAPRSLPGTAWKIDFGRGLTGTLFLFCESGTWQIVPAGGAIGAVGKSYHVSGDTLTTVNRDDGTVQKWKITWRNEGPELSDGRQTLRLHYNGRTSCR